MSYHFITDQIVFLEQIDSTNDFLKKLVKDKQVKAPFCLYTNYQTLGKGQRENTWQSEAGKNLLVSFLVDSIKEIQLLPYLNKCMALSLVEVLKSFEVKNISIKWPNDIYIEDKKIAGILIENVIEGKSIKYCVLGVGLNINQTEFHNLDATSTKNVLNRDLEIIEVLYMLFHQFYKMLKQSEPEIAERVNTCLYKRGKNVTFQLEAGIKEYEVLSISRNGNLCVKEGPQEIELEHHRVKWIK